MNDQNEKKLAVNLKKEKAVYSFKIKIRDREHFYKITKWLDTHVGKGSDKWTMSGRVLRNLKIGRTVETEVYIFKNDFDQESSVYLSLL